MNEIVQEGPLAGLKLPTGEITQGDRPSRTLRMRNARIALALELTGKRVLDLGCAEGLHSLYMSESAKEVVGVDHRTSVIRCAETNKEFLGISNVTFKCGDIRDQSVIGSMEKFDLVVAWGLLHRITDIFSFLQRLSSITDALSLEWRTPVFPLMSHLSLAYHSPVGEVLDPMNLSEFEQIKGDKVEGQTGFFEPTPGTVSAICRRLGFKNQKNLGYGDNLKSEWRTIIDCWGRKFANKITGKKNIQQLPLGRVHFLFEKNRGIIAIKDPLGKDIKIPEWDYELQKRFGL